MMKKIRCLIRYALVLCGTTSMFGVALGQDHVKPFHIPIPQNICGCSAAEEDGFLRQVSDSLEAITQRYLSLPSEPDLEAMKAKAFEVAGVNAETAAMIEGIDEDDSSSVSEDIVQQMISGNIGNNYEQQLSMLQNSIAVAAQNESDYIKVQQQLLPLSNAKLKLQYDAELWRAEYLQPLYDSLHWLTGDPQAALQARIDGVERRYCEIFSPQHLELIRQEIIAMDETAKLLDVILKRNTLGVTEPGGIHLKDQDPAWLYYKTIEKIFEYKIHRRK